MPYPQEYQHATMTFQSFLKDVCKYATLETTHMSYNVAQGVLFCFRDRVALQHAIRFSNLLPAGIRALFVADWDPSKKTKAFGIRQQQIQDVQALRKDHNFAFLSKDPIADVAKALSHHVNMDKLTELLHEIGPEAIAFWET